MLVDNDWARAEGKLLENYNFDHNEEKTVENSNDIPPYHFFSKIFDESIFEFIYDQSKIYLDKYLQEKYNSLSSEESYLIKKSTLENFKKKIGLIYQMGIINLPQEKLYSSKDKLFSLQVI